MDARTQQADRIRLMLIIKQLEKVIRNLNNYESKLKKIVEPKNNDDPKYIEEYDIKIKKVVSNINDDHKYIEEYDSIIDNSDFDDYTSLN